MEVQPGSSSASLEPAEAIRDKAFLWVGGQQNVGIFRNQGQGVGDGCVVTFTDPEVFGIRVIVTECHIKHSDSQGVNALRVRLVTSSQSVVRNSTSLNLSTGGSPRKSGRSRVRLAWLSA